jgi:hypothetical protein
VCSKGGSGDLRVVFERQNSLGVGEVECQERGRPEHVTLRFVNWMGLHEMASLGNLPSPLYRQIKRDHTRL